MHGGFFCVLCAFPVSGPARYTFDAAEGLRAATTLGAGTVVPIHYEGWQHFRQPSEEARAVLGSSPLGERVRWLSPGTPAEIEV